MSNPVLYLLLLCCFVSVESQNWKAFDCRRINSQCRLNVGVCLTDGTCDCTIAIPQVSGFEGFDCNLETSSIVTTPCDTCQNGGTCYRNNMGGISCYCSEEYSGDMCEQRRVDVTVCNDTHIGMYIKPHHATSFNGLISIIQEGNFNSEILLTDPECRRQGLVQREADNSYFILAGLDSTSPCFGALQIQNFTNGIVRFTYKVRVNYAFFQSPIVDETHTFVCEINPGGNQAGVKIGGDRPGLNGTIVSATNRPANLALLLRSGTNPLDDATPFLLYIGQELFVQMKLKPTSYYRKLAVDNCFAYPYSDGSGDSVQFFKDGCPNEQFLSVVDASVGSIRVSDREVLVAFFAIKFMSTSDLFISCDATVCFTSNIDLCAPRNCSSQSGGPFSGHGRRKRDADEDGYFSLIKHSIVLSSREEVDAVLGRKTVVKELCYKNTVFLVLAGIVGVLLTVLLVITVVLCLRHKSIHKSSD